MEKGRIIKSRLALMGRTQLWLIAELGKRGIKVSETEFSHILAGRRNGPKAELVLETAYEIVAA